MFLKTEMNENIIALLEQDLITNLNIFGILENSKDTKLYVDDIKNPTGVVVNIGYINYIYTENDDFTDFIIEYLSKNKGEYGFSGVKSEIAQKIKSRFEVEWSNPCTLYYYDKKSVDTNRIKAKVETLTIEDAEIVDEYYTFRSEDSIFKIIESIKNRTSRCIYKDGELASWLLTHKDNSLGPMFTREEYRKDGYAIDVTLSIVDSIISQGKIPFLQIVKGNKASEKLAIKCGFKQHGDCEWFGIIV